MVLVHWNACTHYCIAYSVVSVIRHDSCHACLGIQLNCFNCGVWALVGDQFESLRAVPRGASQAGITFKPFRSLGVVDV